VEILITNDDGAQAPQLPALIRKCKQWGNVTAVVPKYEQSAKSHSIEIQRAFEIKQVQLMSDVTVWTVDSTPADCVRFAAGVLKTKFDLVISGINRGYNLGWDTMYSGTVAAATEAAHKGMNALAISTSTKYYDRAVDHLEQILRFVEEKRLFDHSRLYNINIPITPVSIRFTQLGNATFREEFVPIGKDLYWPGGKPIRSEENDLKLDTVAVRNGFISVTPLIANRTDLKLLQMLR